MGRVNDRENGKKAVQSSVKKGKKNVEDEKRKRISRPAWNIKGLRYAFQKEVNRFSGCIATINERNQSGKTEQDKIADAKATYEAIYKAKFNLDHAWILLRHQPKWLQTQESVSKKRENQSDFTSFSSSSTERTPIDVDQDNTNDAYAPTKRPLGKKAEKRKMKETTSDEPTPILVQIQTLHEEKKERDERKMELIKKKVEQDEKKTPTQTNGVRDENYVY
ncbi:PREDICTED: glutathione S-transferase T2-like [Prunus mume]|uniref:Glutathione S-transferase T2-like n=1 Tax=Prunus mume TaxID=102107 RepID=A0ABM0PJU7_PRUMU|nr:PREDICTED: glutathione S-transferase T2-like [Prunus mume]